MYDFINVFLKDEKTTSSGSSVFRSAMSKLSKRAEIPLTAATAFFSRKNMGPGTIASAQLPPAWQQAPPAPTYV